jgi:hypothetical protein
LQGHAGRDAATNHLLKTCDILDQLPDVLARRAAQLRRLARTAAHAIGVNVLGI